MHAVRVGFELAIDCIQFYVFALGYDIPLFKASKNYHLKAVPDSQLPSKMGHKTHSKLRMSVLVVNFQQK